MNPLISNEEQKRLRQQFNGRQKILLGSSIFLLLFGILTAVFALFYSVSGEMGGIFCLLCAMTGITDLFFAVWGIRLSGERTTDFSKAELIVYESRPFLAFAWICYFFGLFINLAVIAMTACESYSSILLFLFLLLFLFAWAAFFSSYRNRRILMDQNSVWGMTILGREYTFSRSQIHEVTLLPSLGGFVAKDASGRKLFRFENNMVHAEELFHNLGGTIPELFTEGWQMQWKKASELQWDNSQETEHTQQAHKIRNGYRILFIVNLVLFVFFYIFCPTDILKQKYQLLLLQVLPLCYFIYAWRFHDVMVWLPLPDINASGEWKKHHVGMGFAYIHVFLTMLFITSPILMIQVNFVTGEMSMWAAVLILTFLLFGISCRQTRKIPHRKLTLGACLFLFLIYSMGVIYALIPSISHPSSPTHYPAQAENLRIYEGRNGDDYYGTILLPDGQKAEIEMTSSAYKALQNKEAMVVCDNEASFGIRYIYVHRP